MKPNDAAIRKRTQITKANRTMFIWIAVASALIGSALVVSIFLAQKAIFNEKVLLEKQNTISVLDHNNKVAPDLENQIRVLDTNQALGSSKANENDQAIQVILDALPSDGNSLALGASLQNKLLAGIPGLTIDTLRVDPIIGIETLSADNATVDASTTGASSNVITFSFSVSGSQDAIKAALQNLERSIRLIDIVSVRIETTQQGQTIIHTMTVQAQAYYEPAKTVELKDKVVNP